MNFCLSTVDAYLCQRTEALLHDSRGSQDPQSSEAAAEAAAVEVDPTNDATPRPNSLKSLLHQVAGVAAAAQRIPGGDDYTIRTSTSSSARKAAEAAAADTLKILLDIAVGCSGKSSNVSVLKKAEELHRLLAGPSDSTNNTGKGSSTSNSILLQEHGQQIHEGVGVGIQGLLDELLEAVDLCLEAHRRSPQTRIRAQLPSQQHGGEPAKRQQEQLQQQQTRETAEANDKCAVLGRDGRVISLPSIFSALEGRPQSQWAYLINNDSRRFVPRLHQKPHKKYPLTPATVDAQKERAVWLERRRDLLEDTVSTAAAAETASGQQKQQLLEQLRQHEEDLISLQKEEDEAQSAESTEPLPHPYEGELKDLVWLAEGDKQQSGVYSELFTLKEATLPSPVEETPLVFVETPQQLREMLDELCSGRHKVVAIDTEHHSYESYKGFICLIQLSTCGSAGAAKDFLVDPFSLFVHLTALNELTANPKILKILHGSASDVIWLQRDFSVYLVNVFDTAVAARTLAIPGGASLANLLSFYLKKQKDRKMQLADWRVRPLTKEMKSYGRSDTHYLPYIYQCMQNQLLTRDDQTGMFNLSCITPAELGTPTGSGKAAVLGVMERSRDICLSLYTEGPFDGEKEATQLLKRNNVALAPLSFAALKGLLAWRDSVARKRDVSPHAVLANACILLLAQRRPLDHMQLRSAIRPTPPAVRRYSGEILKAIHDGLQKAATQPPPPLDAQQEAKSESKQRQTQPQEQKQPDQPEPLLDDTDDLLPSAEVLRNAVTAQQQLLAALETPEHSVDVPAGASDNQAEPNAFDKKNSSSSPGSSSSSDTNASSLQQQQQSPVQIGGLFRIGSTGPKPSVVVRISSDVLSCHMENYFSSVSSDIPVQSASVRNASHKARQVARWVYRQLQQMEMDRLLHCQEMPNVQVPEQVEQKQHHQVDEVVSTGLHLLPAHPPPPPDPEIVAAAVEAIGIRGSAATVATTPPEAPSTSPTEAKDATVGNVSKKRGHSAEVEASMGLLPVAQQKWKRRKKQRQHPAKLPRPLEATQFVN
ncbi:exosome component 10, putative [Eimeria tenella]|uniref:Exosome component 10, putative n=1 Tax=Eimeria tenella TaxID=5802 RepID=U6KZ02_EIMTE|nr:exosome component 10, putative [Eimeria tenella]CDJ43191.1 exosome component 10, putative [Eimeria tenella]|eukprot:XP_013233941.1 exosome component 10, putative [Eimeria tenella]